MVVEPVDFHTILFSASLGIDSMQEGVENREANFENRNVILNMRHVSSYFTGKVDNGNAEFIHFTIWHENFKSS